MKTRPLFLFLPALALMGVCGYFGLPVLFSASSAVAQQPEQPQVLNTPEMVYSTPAPEPSPTIGYMATIEIISTQSARDRAAALDSREKEIAARETANAAEALVMVATVTLGAQYNERLSIQAMANSVQTTERAAERAEASGHATQTAEAPAIQATATEIYLQSERDVQNVKLAPVVAVSGALVYPLALALAIAFMLVLLRAPRKPGESDLKVEIQGDDNPAPTRIRLDLTGAYGWGSLKFTELPIPWETLRQVAMLIIENHARYTQAQMTGAGKPLVKDGNFDTFGAWMVQNLIAMRHEDGRYQIMHPEFFEQALNEKR